jgi:hypothetical protein
MLGRFGFTARGIVYLLIGWITLMIALDRRTLEADRTGALELIASKPFGYVVLWFLIVGFAGMALWRAVMAAHPDLPGKNGAGSRLASAGKAVLYAVAAYTTACFTFAEHDVQCVRGPGAEYRDGHGQEPVRGRDVTSGAQLEPQGHHDQEYFDDAADRGVDIA